MDIVAVRKKRRVSSGTKRKRKNVVTTPVVRKVVVVAEDDDNDKSDYTPDNGDNSDSSDDLDAEGICVGGDGEEAAYDENTDDEEEIDEGEEVIEEDDMDEDDIDEEDNCVDGRIVAEVSLTRTGHTAGAGVRSPGRNAGVVATSLSNQRTSGASALNLDRVIPIRGMF